MAKYSVLKDSQQLFASKYVTVLPSEEELKRELQREREQVQRKIEESADKYRVDA